MSLSSTLAFTYEEKAGAGMELAGAERRSRSPEGERAGASESIEPVRRMKASLSNETERDLEAGAGIEPANSGFADRDLTTWLPRRLCAGMKFIERTGIGQFTSSADGSDGVTK